jgi:hypothetical protein
VVGTVIAWPALTARDAGAVADLGPTLDTDTDNNWVTMHAEVG